jgi:hypothetical protein
MEQQTLKEQYNVKKKIFEVLNSLRNPLSQYTKRKSFNPKYSLANQFKENL